MMFDVPVKINNICKKIICGIMVLFVLFSCCACGNRDKSVVSDYEELTINDDDYKFIPVENIEKYQHAEKIIDFDSEISTGYKNKDGTYSLYIFSSPIRCKEGFDNYIDIDNRLKKIYIDKTHNNRFLYKNNSGYIDSWFPEAISSNDLFLVESELYEFCFNMMDFSASGKCVKEKESIWGENNDTMVYSGNNSQINAYATRTGVRTEIVLNELPPNNRIDFLVKTPGLRKKIEDNYLLFMDDSRSQENQIQSIVKTPIVKDSYFGKRTEDNPHIYLDNTIETESIDDGIHKVSFILDKELNNASTKFPIYVDVSWDMHISKQPDSAIYSEMIYDNNYLHEHSMIGNSYLKGIGENYIRLRINEYIDTKPENIKLATYNAYEMSGFSSTAKISLNKIESFWSSHMLNWESRVDPGYHVNTTLVNKEGFTTFDITELAKKALGDESCDVESLGVVMSGENTNNSYRIFASSDNSIFPPFEMITFYDYPESVDIYRK